MQSRIIIFTLHWKWLITLPYTYTYTPTPTTPYNRTHSPTHTHINIFIFGCNETKMTNIDQCWWIIIIQQCLWHANVIVAEEKKMSSVNRIRDYIYQWTNWLCCVWMMNGPALVIIICSIKTAHCLNWKSPPLSRYIFSFFCFVLFSVLFCFHSLSFFLLFTFLSSCKRREKNCL